MLFIVAGVVIAIIVLNKKTVSEITSEVGNTIINNLDFSSNEVVKFIANKFNYTTSEVATGLAVVAKFQDIDKRGVPDKIVYGIIYKESGRFVKEGKPNNAIPGFDGLSIGYFQITKWAVAEFNNREGTAYKYNPDAWNEETNILIGSTYLKYCFDSAEGNIYLTGKKYNGGLDETINSKNDLANSYGKDLEKRVEFFNNILSTLEV